MAVKTDHEPINDEGSQISSLTATSLWERRLRRGRRGKRTPRRIEAGLTGVSLRPSSKTPATVRIFASRVTSLSPWLYGDCGGKPRRRNLRRCTSSKPVFLSSLNWPDVRTTCWTSARKGCDDPCAVLFQMGILSLERLTRQFSDKQGRPHSKQPSTR